MGLLEFATENEKKGQKLHGFSARLVLRLAEAACRSSGETAEPQADTGSGGSRRNVAADQRRDHESEGLTRVS